MDQNLVAANLAGEELEKLMDLEKNINSKQQGNKEVYLIAFEKK